MTHLTELDQITPTTQTHLELSVYAVRLYDRIRTQYVEILTRSMQEHPLPEEIKARLDAHRLAMSHIDTALDDVLEYDNLVFLEVHRLIQIKDVRARYLIDSGATLPEISVDKQIGEVELRIEACIAKIDLIKPPQYSEPA